MCIELDTGMQYCDICEDYKDYLVPVKYKWLGMVQDLVFAATVCIHCIQEAKNQNMVIVHKGKAFVR